MSQPIYISLTSIYLRQHLLYQCLVGVLNQTLEPTLIYLYLSEYPSIFDDGFKDQKITNEKLKKLLSINNNKIIINWGKDIGPYGKFLPILKKKWNEDCLIITIDDDTVYDINLIKNLVSDYNKYKCVISYRGFTPNIKCIQELTYLNRKKIIKNTIFNFPTGKGGILYHPSFFHKTDDLIFKEEIFKNICRTADDVWFMLIRVANNINCYLDNKKWLLKDNHTGEGLMTINCENNCAENELQIKNVIKKFNELGYL